MVLSPSCLLTFYKTLSIWWTHKHISKKLLHLTWTYLTKTLSAPNGVTRIAGANAYAVKLAISPTITGNKAQHLAQFMNVLFHLVSIFPGSKNSCEIPHSWWIILSIVSRCSHFTISPWDKFWKMFPVFPRIVSQSVASTCITFTVLFDCLKSLPFIIPIKQAYLERLGYFNDQKWI